MVWVCGADGHFCGALEEPRLGVQVGGYEEGSWAEEGGGEFPIWWGGRETGYLDGGAQGDIRFWGFGFGGVGFVGE